MQTAETLFERELIKLIEARIAEIGERVNSGMIPSYEEYKAQCGQMDGLRAALEYMPQARENSQQRNR